MSSLIFRFDTEIAQLELMGKQAVRGLGLIENRKNELSQCWESSKMEKMMCPNVGKSRKWKK